MAGDDEPRYAMLETIREYGLEQLDAAGEGEATRKRHAIWAMAFAEQAWTKLFREPLRLAWLDRVEIEHGNLRAALAWLTETGDAERSLWLASGLAPFWLFRSFRIEGRGWLERGLKQAGEEQIPTELRARVLHCLGMLTEGQTRSLQYHEESLRFWRELGDRWGVAAALFSLGFAANNEGDYDRAWTLSDEAVAIFHAMGIKERAADCLCELGRAAYGRGEAQLATTHLEAALALFREVEDSYGIGYALIRLGVVAVDMGDHARASATFREGLAAWHAVGMKEGLTLGLAGVATLAAAGGHAETAGRLVGVVDGLREVLGYELSLPERARYERAEAALHTTLGDTAFAAARAAGRVLPLDTAIAEATAFLSTPVVPVVPIVSQPAFGLTPRELDVLRLLVEGHSDRAIGEALFIGHRTVMTHVANILSKLGVDSRTAAAAQAIRHNLV